METGSHRMTNALLRAPSAVSSRLRCLWLRVLGAEIGKNCWLKDIWVPRNPWDIALEDQVALDRHVTLVTTGPPTGEPRIRIGTGTYVNRFTIFDAHASIQVGRQCMIGPSCYITDADHSFASGRLIMHQPMTSVPVMIQDGVWLGAGVTVLKGVTIGEGAVVGAGAVVTHPVPAGAIVAGVPGRILSQRSAPSSP